MGSDAEKTVLTFKLYASQPGPDGKPDGNVSHPLSHDDPIDFSAEGVTFENSAGPVGQALAVRIDGDRAVFRHCRFTDTRTRSSPTRAITIINNVKSPGPSFHLARGRSVSMAAGSDCVGNGYITAASTPQEQPYGYVFSHCTITAEAKVKRMFLGRPWRRPYASVAYLNTAMPDCISPERLEQLGQARQREATIRNAGYVQHRPRRPSREPREMGAPSSPPAMRRR
ncbi:MAG: pectinesterase family protein [Chthoniobacteraceae bacterium]